MFFVPVIYILKVHIYTNVDVRICSIYMYMCMYIHVQYQSKKTHCNYSRCSTKYSPA